MRTRGKTWAIVIVLCLLAGSLVWPVLADSPTSMEPQGELRPPMVDETQAVGVIESVDSETTLEPQLGMTPSRSIVVKLEGTITARTPTKIGEWQIDETTISVTTDTVIQPSGYDPKVGDHVVVKAWRTPSSMVAIKITVEKPGQQELHPVEFRGVISRCVETPPYWGEWVIGETTVAVSFLTIIKNAPQPGLYAQVRGLVTRDGKIAATYIEVLNPNSAATQFQFKGLVQFMVSGNKLCIIGGVPGEITRTTEIIGQEKITVGSLVEVDGERSGTRNVFTRIALVEEETPVRWDGVIQQAASDSAGEWIIGDKSVLVDEATFVDESHGRAQPGMWAQVTATDINGVYRAQRIRIEQP